MSQAEHRSTARVLEILTLVAGEPEGYTLTQIAEALGAPKSSLFPILQTMRARHFLSYNTSLLCYKIGPAAFQVGMSFVNRSNVIGYVEREMQAIVDKCRETVHFAILDSGDVVYLLKKDSPQAVRMMSTVGLRLPAYGTGIGKALLIDFTPAELRAMYPGGLKPLTPNTITDMGVLYAQLKSYRKDDITYEYEESNEDIRCVGVALRKGGKIVAAMSVAAPIFRCDDEKQARLRLLLLESKGRLEALLADLDFDFSVQ